MFLAKSFTGTGSTLALVMSSRIANVILGLFLVPFYIKFLGAENYGLVSFYATLSGTLVILGYGLSAASSREVAILHAKKVSASRLTSLIFSAEVLNLAIAIFSAIIVLSFASVIAKHWLNAESTTPETITHCIMIMGLLFGCQLPASLYEGFLNGLSQQKTASVVNLVFVAIKSLGVIVVLKYISNTIEAFFLWQLLITLILTLFFRFKAYKFANPSNKRKIFSKKVLRNVRHYAMGMTAISFITFFISQVDKILVSKFLLLEFVGYYNLAFLLASSMKIIILSMNTIVQPKLNILVSAGNQSELSRYYYKACRWTTILIMPVGFILIGFAHRILIIWTKNETLAAETSPALQLIALGTAFNCIANLFYLYTLARGNTKFIFYQNVFSALFITPLIYILTTRYGLVGAASCWLIYNTLLLLVSLPIFHHIFLKGQLWYWFKETFFWPTLLALIIFLGGEVLMSYLYRENDLLVLVVTITILSFLYVLVIKDTRQILIKALRS